MSQVLLSHCREIPRGSETERGGSEGKIDGSRDENKVAEDKWI